MALLPQKKPNATPPLCPLMDASPGVILSARNEDALGRFAQQLVGAWPHYAEILLLGPAPGTDQAVARTASGAFSAQNRAVR